METQVPVQSHEEANVYVDDEIPSQEEEEQQAETSSLLEQNEAGYTRLVMNKALLILGLNLMFVIAMTSLFGDGGGYWQVGPSDDLLVISLRINTWPRYIGLLSCMSVLKGSQIWIEDRVMPLLFQLIYMKDNKVVDDIGRMELHSKGSLIYMMIYLREVLMIKVSISQVDVAVWGVLVSWITQVVVMWQLLKEKQFKLQ